MRRVAWLALLVIALAPSALAQDPWVYPGGEPGVAILAGGRPIEEAASPGSAIDVDPREPLDLSIRISPPGNATWDVRSISVGLLVNGPGSEAPDLLVRRMEADSSIPPGWSVVVNRTVELQALQKVGAGTFLMEATVGGAGDITLYERTFYVHVPAGLATLLTVQGAAIAAVSVATGYGFWQVAKDVKELRDAWERHRKKEELARLDVIGRAEHVVERVAEKSGRPLAAAVSVHRAVQSGEKELRPVRWMATGLGLGGVAVAWLQFLGYIAFDGLGMLVVALEGAAIFLTLALVANYALRKAKARTRAKVAIAPTVSLEIKEGHTPTETAEAAHNRD